MKEEQIAASGLLAIAADEIDVEEFECLCVCKLGEVFVDRRVWAGSYAKEFSTEWRGDVWRSIRSDWIVVLTHFLKPGAIVWTECFAPREANETGAITLFRDPLVADFVKLHFGYPREPATEVFAIVESSEFGVVRESVVVQVR